MANVVNVYLGGTGKYIAGLLKARSAMSNVQPATTLVFDTDRADSQARTYRLGLELRTPGSEFGANLRAALEEWDHLGMQMIHERVEHGQDFDTAMAPYKAARKLIPENRAAGGGMWTLRAHGHLALGRYLRDDEGAVQFLAHTVGAVARHADQGHAVMVNIIASIAGGTGSGVFVPVALKLQERLARTGGGIRPQVRLVIVLPSAFYVDWGSEDSATSAATVTRGLTGAFAAWRELQMLNEPGDPGVVFPSRVIPLLSDGSQTVRYAPNRPLSSQVFWAGMRKTEPNQHASALFDELGRVLAVLSDRNMDDFVNGKAAMQVAASKLCWSAVCIEYPLLELAQKFSAAAVARALDEVAGKADDPLEYDTFYRGFVSRDNARRPLSRFIDGERPHIFHDGRNTELEKAQADNVIALLEQGGPGSVGPINRTVHEFMAIEVAHGTGYSGEGADWEERARLQGQTLDTAMVGDVAICKAAMRHWLEQERQAFSRWFTTDSVDTRLAEGQSAQSLLNTIGNASSPRTIHGELERARRFFLRPFSDVVSDDGSRDCLKGVAHCQEVFAQCKNQLVNPPPGRRMHWFVRGILALAAGIFVGGAAMLITFGSLEFGATVSAASALVLGMAAFILALRRLNREQPIEKRRKDAEDRLFEAYRELRLAHCGEALWGSAGLVNERFLTPLLGPVGAKPGDGGALQRAKDVLTESQNVCRKARDDSDAIARQALRQPPDVAVWIGDDDTPSEDKRVEHIRLIRQHLHVTGIGGGDGGNLSTMSFRIGESGGGHSFSLRDLNPVTRTDATDADRRSWRDFTDALHEQAWDLVRGELGLPPTLQARLLDLAGGDESEFQAILANYLIRAVETMQTRGPAIASSIAVPAPTLVLLVVNGSAMKAQVAQALAHPTLRDRPNELAFLRKGLTDTNANGQPHDTSAVGESITLLALYDLPSVAAVSDIQRSENQYYAINQRMDQRTPPERYCAGNSEFHLLPELSAAASIEFQERLHRPLHPLLVPHLLGSDPTYPGPTTLTLFYLARQLGCLCQQPWQSGISPATTRWVFCETETSNANALPLLVTAFKDDIVNDAAQAARIAVLDPLDALNDLLRYKGEAPGDHTVTELKSGSVACVRDWHTLDSKLLAQQNAIRALWWDLAGPDKAAKRNACFLGMNALLDGDCAKFPEGDLRDSWRAACQANFAAAEKLLSGAG